MSQVNKPCFFFIGKILQKFFLKSLNTKNKKDLFITPRLISLAKIYLWILYLSIQFVLHIQSQPLPPNKGNSAVSMSSTLNSCCPELSVSLSPPISETCWLWELPCKSKKLYLCSFSCDYRNSQHLSPPPLNTIVSTAHLKPKSDYVSPGLGLGPCNSFLFYSQ